MFSWPAVQPHEPAPVWTGCCFRIGGREARVLCYHRTESGWSDDLTRMHEESAGRDHYIDRASRAAALAALGPVLRQPGAVVLEVGCSSGYFLEDLSRRAPTAFAIGADYLEGPLQRLGQRLPGIPLVQFDLTRAPFADGQFDAVVALNVLEHIGDHARALGQLGRLLKPGGLGVIEVPAGEHLYDLYDAHLLHHRRYSRASLVRLAQEVGLEVVEASHLGFVLYPAFAWVKKRNQRLARHLPEAQRQALVCRQIQMARSSRVMNALMSLERWLDRVVDYPCGIRCRLTVRRSAHLGARATSTLRHRWGRSSNSNSLSSKGEQ